MRNQGKSTDLGLFIQTFKSVLLHLPVPCYILDLEGTIVFSNDETIQLTGYQQETDFKRSFLSQLDDEYIDKTIEHFKTVLTGERLQFPIEIRHQNGESIPVNIISIPLEIRGLVQGICGFILKESEKSAVIHQPDFIDSIKRTLHQYNLPPELLKIEITERTAMTDVQKTLKTMRELQEYGVDIILDDFGIGYSSISYLVQYPFNTIKIDKSFIQGLDNKNQKSVCRALVAMGRNLGMNVVAEGVEEMEQYQYLCSIGCHKIQGYYLSRPTSVDLVEKFF